MNTSADESVHRFLPHGEGFESVTEFVNVPNRSASKPPEQDLYFTIALHEARIAQTMNELASR